MFAHQPLDAVAVVVHGASELDQVGDDLLQPLEALLEFVDAVVGHQARIMNERVVSRPWAVTPASPQYANSPAPPPFGSRPVGHIQNGRRGGVSRKPPAGAVRADR